jgi:hypothetical protein
LPVLRINTSKADGYTRGRVGLDVTEALAHGRDGVGDADSHGVSAHAGLDQALPLGETHRLLLGDFGLGCKLGLLGKLSLRGESCLGLGLFRIELSQW